MPHSSLRPSQRLAPRCGQYWSMTPTTPRESRKASSSSPITTIFFGVPSASGSSSDSSTGIQNRRSNSPIGVPAPDSVRNLLSSARSMETSGANRFGASLEQAGASVNVERQSKFVIDGTKTRHCERSNTDSPHGYGRHGTSKVMSCCDRPEVGLSEAHLADGEVAVCQREHSRRGFEQKISKARLVQFGRRRIAISHATEDRRHK